MRIHRYKSSDCFGAEPGPTATSFATSLVRSASSAIYKRTPADEVRAAIDSGPSVTKGDAARTVKAIIAAADEAKPDLRIALGSTAYASLSKALDNRRASLEAQRHVAFSADKDD